MPPEPRTAIINGHAFTLEIAATPEEQALGLMHRASLPRDTAMLFVSDREVALAFWMKTTLIPLDILFLDSEGVIVDIQAMQPQPGVQDSQLKRYISAVPARYAIEMNAELAKEYRLETGMRVEFR